MKARPLVIAVPAERILSGDSHAYKAYENKRGDILLEITIRGGAKIVFEFEDESQLRGFMNRLTGATMRIKRAL